MKAVSDSIQARRAAADVGTWPSVMASPRPASR